MKTPWAPGKWYGSWESGAFRIMCDDEIGRFTICDMDCPGGEESMANAALISLAPKMAEAILEWHESEIPPISVYMKLNDIVNKLRQIMEETDD